MILDRLSAATIAREWLNFDGPISGIRAETQRAVCKTDDPGRDQRAFQLFQLAQVRGWTPHELQNLDATQWKTLLAEVDAFSGIERRRIFQHAFERRYRNQTLDAVLAHSKSLAQSKSCVRPKQESSSETPAAGPPPKNGPTRPAYQLWCCIDDREESFRRHLEEVDPDCETFGIAGFFGVAMYYRGTTDAHFKPLCPVNIKPKHYIVEQPLYSSVQSERMRAEARRRIGHATHQARKNTRTVIGSLLIGALGPLAAIPLVGRVLFPRHSARVRKLVSGMMQTSSTELRLERIESDDDANSAQLGYSVPEMARIVEGALRAIGVCKTDAFAPLVIVCGHGSSSLNNPHEAAYDCGACGGARGGPNARAFAQMANDMRVRRILHERGINIPDETTFVGAYHNTCDDSVTWFDLDRIPVRCRSVYERAKGAIDQARQRDAHERCRRFESADLAMSPLEAMRHVEGRSEDLSQARPECGHATNACGFVGRREWSRNLFLDRRVFLTSYDPAQDDDKGSILEGMLRAVIPVCAGISLEYYFSYVDPTGYGCGTKLPHNVTSLIGVMDGAASDLRPGLPWQMVEIHEPVRLLFLIETTTSIMRRIVDENEAISRLVKGEWVQLALLDPDTGQIRRYTKGEFVPYRPESTQLPVVASSADWYHGHREHLGFASILAHRNGEDRMKGMQTL